MQHSCPAATASFAQTGAADTLVAYNHNGKWGFVGRHAADVTFVIEPAYEMAYPFYEGRAAVRKDNLWGFIDATGKLLIPYQFFCCEKLPFLQRPCRSKKKVMVYGVIDAAGKTIMPFTFTETWLYPNQQVIVASSTDPKNPADMFGLQGMYDYRGKQLLKGGSTRILILSIIIKRSA